MKEFVCKVQGNVQGVLFRNFVSEKALELGLTGTAENMPDGTVEVVAQGQEADLRKLLEYVYTGPENAEVESASVQWGPAVETLVGFKIL